MISHTNKMPIVFSKKIFDSSKIDKFFFGFSIFIEKEKFPDKKFLIVDKIIWILWIAVFIKQENDLKMNAHTIGIQSFVFHLYFYFDDDQNLTK